MTRAGLRAMSLASAALLLFDVGLAQAHHAWTEIDTAKTLTLSGTVKSLQWENPHARLVLEIVDGGARVEWTVLMSGLARMERRGVTRSAVAVGKAIVVIASPARDAARVVRVVRANRIRCDGRDHVLY